MGWIRWLTSCLQHMKNTNGRVLILYASAGQGHVSSARSIKEAFLRHYPNVVVEDVDIIDYANKVFQKFFISGYEQLADKAPAVWGFLYHTAQSKSRQQFFQLVSQLALESRLLSMIQEFKPDMIVATHFLPAKIISFSKQQDLISIPSTVVVTDYGCHNFWVDEDVNYYCVATDTVSACLRRWAVPAKKIIVTGIPIHQKFSQKINRLALFKKFGLDQKRKTLLIVGGQFTISALKKIIQGIQQRHADSVQFLVVAGRDQKLQQALKGETFTQADQVKVFGFVDNMEELMTVSDLLFSKAGGLTVSEALAKGLPMVINKVIPGQEEDNVNYLVSCGAAIKTSSFDGIVEQVNALLAKPQQLEKMKQAAQSVGKPQAAKVLADFVVKKIS